MKKIEKTSPPIEFKKYCRRREASFKDLSENHVDDVKNILRESLLKEQGYICAYCGKKIGMRDSVIEHIHNKADYPKLQLEYQNIVCSCDGGKNKRQNEPSYPLHCDAKKNKQEIAISPLDDCCERRFVFDEDGEIYSKEEGDQAAMRTIDILGLDTAKISHMRKAAIETYKWIESGDIPIDWIKEYDRISRRNTNGCFEEFVFVIQDYIRQYKLKIE